MTTAKIRQTLQKVSKELQNDARWDLWSKGRTLTQEETEKWVRYNRPDIADLLSAISKQEAEDKGFILAIVAVGNLMGGYK